MNRRLAVAIEESGSDERVAEHFGRCSKFYICELDEENRTVKQESYFNPLNGEHGGACQLPAYVKQFNVDTIIAGGMGRKAVAGFHELGMEVITAQGLLYGEAVELFALGKVKRQLIKPKLAKVKKGDVVARYPVVTYSDERKGKVRSIPEFEFND